MPMDEKITRADFVIENNGSKDELEHRVGKCVNWLKIKSGDITNLRN